MTFGVNKCLSQDKSQKSERVITKMKRSDKKVLFISSWLTDLPRWVNLFIYLILVGFFKVTFHVIWSVGHCCTSVRNVTLRIMNLALQVFFYTYICVCLRHKFGLECAFFCFYEKQSFYNFTNTIWISLSSLKTIV